MTRAGASAVSAATASRTSAFETEASPLTALSMTRMVFMACFLAGGHVLTARICSCRNRDASRMIRAKTFAESGTPAMPDLDDIRAFTEVVDSGSLTPGRGAARDVEVDDQPAAGAAGGGARHAAAGAHHARHVADRGRRRLPALRRADGGRAAVGARRAEPAGRGDRAAAAHRADVVRRPRTSRRCWPSWRCGTRGWRSAPRTATGWSTSSARASTRRCGSATSPTRA